MHITSLQFAAADGWSQAFPAECDGPDTLVLAFGASGLVAAPGPLHALAAAFPRSVLLGCSTSGEIAATQVGDAGITAVVARFERSKLQRASTPIAGPGDSEAAGLRLARQLPATGLRAVFMLSAGVQVNGTALVRGVVGGLPPQVQVSGGLAGDGHDFLHTWVLEGGTPTPATVSAVGLYGDALHIGVGCCGGWQDFGPERRITRAEGPVLYELDGRPALALYREYLGDLARDLPGSALRFPLSLRTGEAAGPMLVRTILGIDEATQSMTFAGDMPLGARARLMRTSLDRLVGGAAEAADAALSALVAGGAPADVPVLAISVSCIGRRLVLGARVEEEVDAVAEQMPSAGAHLGFYSYGEVASSLEGHCADLHNQTMTVTVLAEA